jgi:hypothetical protein
MSDKQRDIARQKAREIMQRMRTDPAFVRQLQDDPQGTLAAAGMPADVLNEAVDGLGLGPDDDVAGHSVPQSRPSGRFLPRAGIWAEAAQEEADQKAD